MIAALANERIEGAEASRRIAQLEIRLQASEKVNAVLMDRIEQRNACDYPSMSVLEQNCADERAVANKTRALDAEQQELRRALENLQKTQALLLQAQKMELIGQLAAGMAHEINTPIQYVTDNVKFVRRCFDPVMTVVDLIFEVVADWHGAGIKQERIVECEALLQRLKFDYIRRNVPAALEQALEGLQRVASIVTAMKGFSHPSTGEKEAVDLGDVIKIATTVSRNEWKYVADLEMHIDPDLPPVPCLRDEIGQVVLNLLINAAHAVAEKVKASGCDTKGRISIDARRVGDAAEMRITDSGDGIPEHIRTRVFDPFFTTKPVGRGTGQGLAISFVTVVEKHHGQIHFETKTGFGTTFVVRLPLGAGIEGDKSCV